MTLDWDDMVWAEDVGMTTVAMQTLHVLSREARAWLNTGVYPMMYSHDERVFVCRVLTRSSLLR